MFPSNKVMDTEETAPTHQDLPTPSQRAIESVVALCGKIRTTFLGAADSFESKWAAAQAVCSSATQDECLGRDEFDALKRQGPKIIQFIVYKLAQTDDNGQNAWGVFLYNAIETDPTYRPTQGSDESLQHLRCRIVELNYERNQIADERVNAWKQYHADFQMFYSGSSSFTGVEGYYDLLEMGPSIIPQIMIAYHGHYMEYWYELLHEMIHGRKIGAYMLNHRLYHDECMQFFDGGIEHDQAPEYIQTIADRHFVNGEPWPPGYVFDQWSGQARKEG
ncbi:hypothetical protein GGR57DRAFT_476541 [Xylariaceae sp. FL1272]|nr:hypothetical protein GGR57DRAFT_476541 [Xylariaceae sp. FL1272]